MTQNRDFFTPESVDTQVERLSSYLPVASAQPQPSGKQARGEDGAEKQDAPARLVRELQAYYQADYQQNQAFLTRARRRIAAHQITHDSSQARTPMEAAPVLSLSQERTRKMQDSRSKERTAGRKLSRGLGLMAAALVGCLLVGALALVLTLTHGQTGLGSGPGPNGTPQPPSPTATPLRAQSGTVIYTKKSPAGTIFGSVAWSPDGARAASMTIDQKTDKTTLFIWNAANGNGLLTFPLEQKDLQNIRWSPTGKYLELDNLATIVIVDSHSGKVVKTIQYQGPTAFNASSASQPMLSSAAPLGSGYGFYSVAWSPNGASLGVAISNLTSGKVVLLDPLTGAVQKTFSEQAKATGLDMAFSSDGQYLAVSYANDSKLVIWRVATQHAAFTLNDSSMYIGWQPGTHNLARSANGWVQLWDMDTNKLLRTYMGGEGFAWSSDGKKLAVYKAMPSFGLSNQNVTILNAETGAQLSTDTTYCQAIVGLAWSPDGGSIVVSENMGKSSQIIVWAA